jgi:hypothetical protein
VCLCCVEIDSIKHQLAALQVLRSKITAPRPIISTFDSLGGSSVAPTAAAPPAAADGMAAGVEESAETAQMSVADTSA